MIVIINAIFTLTVLDEHNYKSQAATDLCKRNQLCNLKR